MKLLCHNLNPSLLCLAKNENERYRNTEKDMDRVFKLPKICESLGQSYPIDMYYIVIAPDELVEWGDDEDSPS